MRSPGFAEVSCASIHGRGGGHPRHVLISKSNTRLVLDPVSALGTAGSGLQFMDLGSKVVIAEHPVLQKL